MRPGRRPSAGLKEETRQSYSVRPGVAVAVVVAVRLPDSQAQAALLMGP